MTYHQNIEKKLEQGLKQTKRSVFGFLIQKYRITYLIIIAILFLGLFSALTLPKESEPEIVVPFAVVNTVYPGANPADVEDLVTVKLEDKIKNLDDLNKYTSISKTNLSSIFVEFNAEADLAESFRKLREKVDEAKVDLPDDANEPSITEVNFNDLPIVTYSLSGMDERALKQTADFLKNKLEQIQDVSRVEIIGDRDREFQVILNQKELEKYHLNVFLVMDAIAKTNFSLPLGTIDIDNFEYGVRVSGKIRQASDLENVVVATINSAPIYLKNIAEIKDSFHKRETISKIGFPKQESQNAISLQVYKKTKGNILNIVEKCNALFDKLKKENKLPKELIIQKTNDNSIFIKRDLGILGKSGVQTMVLITLILMSVLSLRGAIITALSVPLAFFLTFVFLKSEDMTINSMVLFSLVLSLGLMVDNAIVIIEGINDYRQKHNKSLLEASLLSVWNYKWAITSGTMTTVSAFLPMLLVSGLLGQYLSILPKTISVALISSLFVALVVIPTLATRFMKTSSGARNKKRHEWYEKKMQIVYAHYKKALRNILTHNRYRRSLIAFAWFLFFIAALMPMLGFMKIELFPKVDMDYFVVNIKTPVGSNLFLTEQETSKAEKIIAQIPELDNYVTTIGASMNLERHGGSGNTRGTHLANIFVNLKAKKDRDRKSYEIANDLRAQLKQIKTSKITIDELSAGPPQGAQVEVRVLGKDLNKLFTISNQLQKELANIDGLLDIKNSMENSAGEFVFTINKEKANYYGLNTADIARAMRLALYGATASDVNIDSDNIDIVVKYNEGDFKDVSSLEEIVLPTQKGNISIKEVASFELKPSLLNIEHRDGKRVATISASARKDANLQEILKIIKEKINKIQLDDDTDIQIGGENEDIDKSFAETFWSMGVAVLLIAFILVMQFDSFRQPFVIIFSLPLAVIGVIFGLTAIRQPFSFPAFIGIVALAGIVVNDAIVLIDKINKNRQNGMSMIDAIVDGGVARMQPIILTSLTTIAGIFPLIYADEVWRGLSLAIVFGLSLSTFLTLFIIPAMYFGLSKKEN